MTTYYLDIRASSDILDLGLDGADRQMFAFNIIATSRSSDDFEKELVSVLVDAAVGTLGTNLFAMSKAEIPTGAGPYTSIRATGGPTPLATQESPTAYRRRTAQVVARATNSLTARAKIEAAFDALTAIANQELTAA